MAYYYDLEDPEKFNTDKAAIEDAIRNILMTPVGTMPGRPTFGSRINELIFSQIDELTIELLKQVILEALDYWETRISIQEITVDTDEAHNVVTANITYYYVTNRLMSDTTSVSFSY